MFIGDNGDTYIITTKRSIKGTLEGNVPSGKDAGQTALISSIMNGGYVQVVLTETNGYTITVPSGLVTSIKKGQDAAETVTISAEFRNNGAFTIV